jgi:hypothetical protein
VLPVVLGRRRRPLGLRVVVVGHVVKLSGSGGKNRDGVDLGQGV